MKKRFTILAAAFALLAFLAIPMGMRGQTLEDVTLSNGTFSTDHITWTCANGNISITQLKGTSTNAVNSNYISAPRLYKGHILSFEGSNDYTITNISITYTGNYMGNSMTAGTVISDNVVTDNTTDVDRTWATTTNGGVHQISSVSEDGLPAIHIQNVASSTNVQLRPTAISVTYIGSGTTPTTYTVTYDCNGGTSGCPENVTGITAGTSITLAAAPTKTDYTFDGWNDGSTTYEAGANYTVSGNVTFTAQWTENTPPTPGGETATLNIQAYAEANSWVNGTKYTEATVAPVTFIATGGGNTGKYYTNGQDWRYYQNENASITISVPEGYTLVSVTPTYSIQNTGVLKNGNSTITSGSTVAISGTSVTFTVGNSGTSANGQVRFTNIDVVYVSDGGTQTASDLTITNESTDLTFDLYNNTTAQVISYTTSSTGAITITPAESDYFSYVHDAAAKTITVTPTAVTPSAQTVTINQAADDDYYAGTATFTVSVANSDPNIPGTEANPYTVAQARAAIDANAGTQGVYATGIVSEIVTEWSTQYNNITFNFVDEEGDEDFLQAYRCASGTGVDASQVAVGDVVVVYGNLTKYGSTYEFGQGCQLVSLTHPTGFVEAPTFNPVAGTYTEAQTVTISCETPNVDIYYTLDGTDPDDESMPYSSPITVNATTTIKAIAYDGNEQNSAIATATYHFCSADDPYTVIEALAFNEYPANGIFVSGIVSTAPTQNPTNNGELTYHISVDGNATNQLEVYKGKGLNDAAFTAQNDIQVGDIVTIYGNVVIYGTNPPIKEFAQGNYLVSFERPAQQYTLTVTCSENVEIFTFIGDSTDPAVEGATTQQVTNGTEVGLSVSVPEGYDLTLMVDGTDVTSQLDETGYYTFYMPTHDVSVSATAVAFEPVTYTLVTNTEQIEIGMSSKTYIIVGKKTIDGVDSYYAMGEQRNKNRGGVAISVDGTTATVETSKVHEFMISGTAWIGPDFDFNNEDQGIDYSIYDTNEASQGYLYAASSTENVLKTEAEPDANANWDITIDENGQFSIVAQGSNNHNVMRFNYNGGNPLFSCYHENNDQLPVYLYVKEEAPQTVTQTIELTTGWNNISIYLTIDDPVAMLDQLKEGLGENALVIEGREGFTEFDGEEWFGDLDNLGITNEQSYMINVMNSCTVELQGMPANPTNYEITINPGWNRIGFPSAEELEIKVAIGGFTAIEGDMIDSPMGYTEFDGEEWFGDIDMMVPGVGYMYLYNGEVPTTLIIQTGAKTRRVVDASIVKDMKDIRKVGSKDMTKERTW